MRRPRAPGAARRLLASEAGSGLVMSLMATAMFGIVSLTIYCTLRYLSRESVYYMRAAQAHEAAEAGLESALYQLRLDPLWRGGYREKSFWEGAYTVTLSTEDPPWVTATGYSASITGFGRAARTIRAKAKFTSAGDGYAVESDARVTVNGAESLVDSYDSAVDVAPALFGSQANIWSNGSAETLSPGLRIRGSLNFRSGPEPEPSSVAGEIVLATERRELAFYDGSSFATRNNNSVLPPDVYDRETKMLSIPSGVNVFLDPGNYYLNGIDVQGTLTARAGGPVNVYLNGDLSVTGAVLNLGGVPSRLNIYGQGAANTYNIGLYNLAPLPAPPLHARLLSRDAAVTIERVVYGKVVGSRVDFGPKGVLHFDISAGRAAPDHAAWEPGTWVESSRRR